MSTEERAVKAAQREYERTIERARRVRRSVFLMASRTLSLAEIAKAAGLSKARAQQIVEEARRR